MNPTLAGFAIDIQRRDAQFFRVRARLSSRGPRASQVACATLIAAALLGPPARALANGRYPQANQIVVAPNDASHLYLRATFGLLVSKDGGATWDWICESAFGDTTNYGPEIGVTASEEILVASSNGLWTSPDGCAWSTAPAIGPRFATDLVVRGDDASQALAVTSDYASPEAGVSSFASQVFATSDDGATWSALGAPVDPPVLVATIEVATNDPARIYVSGFQTSTTASAAYVITSSDRGAHWTSSTVPLVAGDLGVYLAAVDPTNADRVYVRTSNQSGGVASARLLVSDDGAKTFRSVYAGGAMLGFALSPDGGEVFVGGLWPSDGLHAAPSDTLAFTPKATLSIECLGASGAKLYECGDAFSSFPLGVSSDDGATFAAALDFHAIRGPLACPASSPVAACAAQWPALEKQLGLTKSDGGTATSDGGAIAPDAGVDAAAPTTNSDAPSEANAGASGGCVTSPDGPRGTYAIAALLGALAVLGARAARRRG